jgi:aryl-alcohol dehydrogenase-like predicted oxidoreductase
MSVVGALDRSLDGELSDRWIEWRDSYMAELMDLMRELRRQAAEKTKTRSTALAAAVDPLLPEERRHEGLSRKALWILKSTPGVTSVLNGMRTPDYVDDSVAVLGWSELENASAFFEAAG